MSAQLYHFFFVDAVSWSAFLFLNLSRLWVVLGWLSDVWEVVGWLADVWEVICWSPIVWEVVGWLADVWEVIGWLEAVWEVVGWSPSVWEVICWLVEVLEVSFRLLWLSCVLSKGFCSASRSCPGSSVDQKINSDIKNQTNLSSNYFKSKVPKHMCIFGNKLRDFKITNTATLVNQHPSVQS